MRRYLCGFSKFVYRRNIVALLLSLFVATFTAIQTFPYVQWSSRDLAVHGLLSDDSFFYSVAAKNFNESGHLTFDGEMPTNGLQPLWLALQIILGKIFPHAVGSELLARANWLCYMAFAFLAVYYISRRYNSWTTALAALPLVSLILLNVRFQSIVLKGLETPLMLFVLVLSLFIVDCVSEKQNRFLLKGNLVWISACLSSFAALTFLCRLDLFWVPIVFGLWLFWKGKIFSRSMAVYLLVLAVLILPYLTYNYATQGNIVPISARVKLFYFKSFYPTLSSYLGSSEWKGLFSAFRQAFLPSRLNIFGAAVILLGLALVLLSIWYFRRPPGFPPSLKLLTSVVLLHVVYMQFFYRELLPSKSYYFAPELLWSAFIFSRLLVNMSHSDLSRLSCSHTPRKYGSVLYRRYGAAFITFCCIVLSITYWFQHQIVPQSYWVERVKLSEDLRCLTSQNERLAAFWPGCIAEFSKRLVIPLDGVIGSEAYFRNHIKTGTEIKYLRERGVKYIALYLPQSPDEILSEEEPFIDNWTMLGVRRLWENRQLIKRVVASRPVRPNGSGWYAFELVINSQ